MIVGALSLQELSDCFVAARLHEPYIFVYAPDGLVEGLVTGYLYRHPALGPTAVFQHIIITHNAKDRARVKREMPRQAIRACGQPTILTTVETTHPLRPMLTAWVQSLGGVYYNSDADGDWYILQHAPTGDAHG